MNKNDIFDLCTDYLITSFSATTATGLSTMLDGNISHNQVSRFLSKQDFTSEDLWMALKLVAMSAFDWVKNPAMLLHAIHHHRATLCWLPNFAFSFLADRIDNENLNQTNLSSIRALINCSEPLSLHSHEKFIRRFKSFQLNRDAIKSCYAMAETTFAITSGGFIDPLSCDIQKSSIHKMLNAKC